MKQELNLSEEIEEYGGFTQKNFQIAIESVTSNISEYFVNKDSTAFASSKQKCSMEKCFDYSRCPITSPFSLFVYHQELHNDAIRNTSGLFVNNPDSACLFLVIVKNVSDVSHLENSTYWQKTEGKNHLIIDISNDDLVSTNDLGDSQAMIASYSLRHDDFRPKFDLILPQVDYNSESESGNISPKSRKFLLSFQGENPSATEDEIELLSHFKMADNNRVYIRTNCVKENSVFETGWQICASQKMRQFLLRNSMFVLIFPPTEEYLTTRLFQIRLYEALQAGAVPIVIGGEDPEAAMPFNEQVDWSRAALFISSVQARNLLNYLGSLEEFVLFEMKRQGKQIWMKYMQSTEAIVESVIQILRARLKMPSLSSDGKAQFYSPISSYEIWNDIFDPFPMPGKQLIRKDFGKSYPQEEFTIVIMTYKREMALVEAIARLKGLPNLNKIVIVNNAGNHSSPWVKSLWSKMKFPVVEIVPTKNSVNNRFIPNDVIETDAILSLDDDIKLSKEDILFGFRVWQRNRDNLVGFTARKHDYDPRQETWKYHYHVNSSPRYSMVLTGAAFLHKYYTYVYTYAMPQAIRSHVDEHMNCEDIAMNFLISHTIRKPPLLVHSNFRFARVKKGTGQLHNTDQYLNNRNQCLNYFSDIYGYMPLLYNNFDAIHTLSKW